MENELHESKALRSHHITQLDFLKSNLLRARTQDLNALQLERDSIITQTQLIKYALFEQVQQADQVLDTYRTSLTTFRLTLVELEQKLKQQTDDDLSSISDADPWFVQRKQSIDQPRPTIKSDVLRLLSFLENQISEKQLSNVQLEKTLDDFQEKIRQLKQSLIKKQTDCAAMDHTDKQLNHNLTVNASFSAMNFMLFSRLDLPRDTPSIASMELVSFVHTCRGTISRACLVDGTPNRRATVSIGIEAMQRR